MQAQALWNSIKIFITLFPCYFPFSISNTYNKHPGDTIEIISKDLIFSTFSLSKGFFNSMAI